MLEKDTSNNMFCERMLFAERDRERESEYAGAAFVPLSEDDTGPVFHSTVVGL